MLHGTLLSLIVLTTSGLGMLGEVSLQDFKAQALCGLIVRTERVSQISAQEAVVQIGLGESYAEFIVNADMAVIDHFLPGDCEGLTGDHLAVLFSEDVHSSKPERGEIAVLFPRKEGEVWLESVFGRSYWPVLSDEQGEAVELTWRNDFLLGPLELRSGEIARVPLSAVKRLLER